MSGDQKTSTPKRKKENEEDMYFSPIKSPVPQIGGHRQGNLTGSLRKVKDTAADIHNQILKWKNLNTDGLNVISDIANTKLEKVFGQEGEDGMESVPLPENLEPLCETLTQIYTNMEVVVKKLQQLKEAMHGVEALMKFKGGDGDILFRTWNIYDFLTTLEQLTLMYETELKLKKSIVENVAHAENRPTMMFYTSVWVHQPYIEDSAQLLLESLLTETGHR